MSAFRLFRENLKCPEALFVLYIEYWSYDHSLFLNHMNHKYINYDCVVLSYDALIDLYLLA